MLQSVGMLRMDDIHSPSAFLPMRYTLLMDLSSVFIITTFNRKC